MYNKFQEDIIEVFNETDPFEIEDKIEKDDA